MKGVPDLGALLLGVVWLAMIGRALVHAWLEERRDRTDLGTIRRYRRARRALRRTVR